MPPVHVKERGLGNVGNQMKFETACVSVSNVANIVVIYGGGLFMRLKSSSLVTGLSRPFSQLFMILKPLITCHLKEGGSCVNSNNK